MTRTNSCIILFSILFIKSSFGQIPNQVFQFTELSYGIYQSKSVAKDGRISEATTEHSVIDDIILVKKTDRVKAKLGVEFGAAYVLKSSRSDTITLEIEWVYPKEIKDPTNEAKVKNIRYAIELPTNFENNSNYTLESDYEVVTGEWQLNIYFKNKAIYRKTFTLE